MILVQSLKDWYAVGRPWKKEEEWKPSKLQRYWDRPEYWEESWRLAVTQILVKDDLLPLSKIIIIIIISTRRPDLILISKKKMRICKIVDFAVPADHRIKLKECEKKYKYLDRARESKKLWNMKVTIIPTVIGTFGTVIKGLLKGQVDLEVGGRVATI